MQPNNNPLRIKPHHQTTSNTGKSSLPSNCAILHTIHTLQNNQCSPYRPEPNNAANSLIQRPTLTTHTLTRLRQPPIPNRPSLPSSTTAKKHQLSAPRTRTHTHANPSPLATNALTIPPSSPPQPAQFPRYTTGKL
jgi:hypothetical protein